jgi:hypothetical protein
MAMTAFVILSFLYGNRFLTVGPLPSSAFYSVTMHRMEYVIRHWENDPPIDVSSSLRLRVSLDEMLRRIMALLAEDFPVPTFNYAALTLR